MAILLNQYGIYKKGVYMGIVVAPDENLAKIAYHMENENGRLSDITNPEVLNAYEARLYTDVIQETFVFDGFILTFDPELILFN